MSNSFDTYATDGQQSHDTEEPSYEPETETLSQSRGFIRAGIVGIILFLAVLGLTSVVKTWLFAGDTDDVQLANSQQSVLAQPSVKKVYNSEYDRLSAEWKNAKAQINADLAAKRTLLNRATEVQSEITVQQKMSEVTANEVTKSAAALSKAQNQLATEEAALNKLRNSEAEKNLSAAKQDLAQASALAAQSRESLQAAKAEYDRTKSTVSELRRAAKAARAAADATQLVVVAVESAKLAVANNQDVMASADAPTLSNLENDFFREAQLQADNSNKSALAAQKAVVIGETRMTMLAKVVSERQVGMNNAAQAEKQSYSDVAAADKQVQALTDSLNTAEDRVGLSIDLVASAKDRLEQATNSLNTRQAKLKELQVSLTRLSKESDAAVKSLASRNAAFLKTESNLKKVQREETKKDAVTFAEINSLMHDQLKSTLGNDLAERPIFDRIVLSSEMLFDTGSAQLGTSGRATLQKIVPIVKTAVQDLPEGKRWVLRVDGHTDKQPLSGSGRYKDNWELSQARALAVVKFLISAGQLEPTRLSANGFGEFQPLNSATSEAAMAENRRIELKIAAN